MKPHSPAMTRTMLVAAAALLAAGAGFAGHAQEKQGREDATLRAIHVLDRIISPEVGGAGPLRVRIDSLPAEDVSSRYGGLTNKDFELVAGELGVEIAAIKAVVAIEAGSQMKGFWAPGVPVVNFDKSMYSRFRKKGGKGKGSVDTVPSGLKGYELREWTLLINARKVDTRAANMGTFWGMFQIGGFNYAKCGCESIEEFIRLMSYSELEQLELFAAFITNTGMLADLKNKNWAAFARKYNGASYARRGYHTKMDNAYRRFSQQKKQ